MTERTPSCGCLLCDEVKNTSPLSVQLGRCVEPRMAFLLESEHFALLPDLFPLMAGHCLMISKPHFVNMACRDAVIEREFRDFWHTSYDFISKKYGAPLAFEHGSTNEALGGGSCVFHAHIHLIPARAPVEDALRVFGRIETFPMTKTWITSSEVGINDYLAYHSQDGSKGFVAPLIKAPPCQFIRRFIAHYIGFAHWNWKAALFSPSSRQTPPPVNSCV